MNQPLNKNKSPILPHSPGVYLMRDVAGRIIYIGKAIDLKKRVASYFLKSKSVDPGLTGKIHALMDTLRHIDYITTKGEREALVLERKLINRYQPAFNTMWKDDKSYPYVEITTSEDFPRIHLIRIKIKVRGNRYFGPYPSVGKLRHLLKWAWRKKLFPLRPCKFDIRDKNPLPYEKVKTCIYLHTKECTAPCLGLISSKKYKESIAKKAVWFFERKQEKLIHAWEKEMRRQSKKMEYEQAAQTRDRIEALHSFNERVTYRNLSESDVLVKVQESRAVQDLMKDLGMQRPPEHIECFDISHIQGNEKVASMVLFRNGRPDKSQYRKYIIRTVAGIDDFKSMAEVVHRRYERVMKEKLDLPDLVLLDGGKGQLQAALKALDQKTLKSVTLAALAKREEEIFLPDHHDPIKLPLDSKGLLLLRYIRDEAHRFALGFHRLRRRKNFLNREVS